MGIQIEDGSGEGIRAKVNEDKRLMVDSVARSIQNHASVQHAIAYQVLGETTLAAATKNILFLTNTHTSFQMWITYIRIQVVGASGGTFGTATYFDIAKDLSYSTGGTAVTPTNMNFTSGNVAIADAYEDNPTLTGTAVTVEKWHPTDGTQNTYNKEGALILGTNSSIVIRITTDHTSGSALARISFIYGDPEHV